ncbi:MULTISPECIES: cyclic peptide export ABC transporter [Methylobacter]|jgi:putative ATP-binding cassette transporter|uniref:Cyclic peptide transporter n=2 Tax=Methylobacter tundripaludum TaxID=173365 RepID=G3J052_METTV|nr:MULTISPECIES: cyclic peptide export ABC transporter [Methylobacter]EGW20574.1 cyclic peptide transporter [Methylobacter tundripaludum SV96]MDI1279366.1 cyclic peptide export ABC transporter [Methylobacter sp.]MDI1360134.1 cyclic peptide export ABC transporter [Methylobacter sp.]PPK75543.1 putative ATP-binding cassette transporter [Methylobacter tundripaludum]
MPLIELIRRHVKTSAHVFIILALLSGVSNVLVMTLINTSAGVEQATLDLRTIAMFGLVIGIYIVSQRGLMRITATEVESMIHNLRMALVENISHAELLSLEQVGRSEILAGMIRDTQTISQASNILVIAVQSVIMIALSMVYVFLINKVAFALSLSFIALSMVLILRHMLTLREELNTVFKEENHLYDGLRDVLEGFKEVKMSVPRRIDILAEIDIAATRARDVKIAFQGRAAQEFMLSQTMIFLLLGLIVFVAPMFFSVEAGAAARTAAAMLFIVGPLAMVTQAIPIFATANAAAENLVRLEHLLQSLATKIPGMIERPLPAEFEEIHFDTVSFTYTDSKSVNMFTVGPFNFSIRQGDTLFITGGNGSGKSTLVKLLVGLYYPEKGVIRIDQQALSAETYTAYRSKFSVIFSDYHLFKRMYGLNVPNPEVIEELCLLLEILGKVRLQDANTFDTIDLSTGQRKRLALLVTLLEDKPIIVLDEWAADQDPHFRRKFYQELLPHLKALGKTIIAITHDDRYFDTADRCIALEEGRIVSDINSNSLQ